MLGKFVFVIMEWGDDMNTILLVDGSNLLFQMFYGMPNEIKGKHGADIRGTVGFVGAILRMIKMTEPSHVAIFFDGEHENERCGISAEYKANRPDYSNMSIEETPFCQLPYIYAALEEMGIRHSETSICEADDWLSGYALKYGMDTNIIISSGDSDLFQLITSNVKILRYRGEQSVLCDKEYVYNKLGVYPERYADFKSLTGDSSDNIKGCDKVGTKTAAALVAQFASLEALIEGADGISKPSIRKSVIECKERILLNRRLIKLEYRGELPFAIEEIAYNKKYSSSRSVLDTLGI